MKIPRTQRLLARTARRLYLANVCSGIYAGFLAALALVLLAICAARLLGLFPSELVFQWLAAPFAIALGAALLFVRKPALPVIARSVDTLSGSKELFLTAALLSEGSSEFSQIVADQAEAKAETIEPKQIVPLRWQRPTFALLAGAALVAAAALWLPQLDPFGTTAMHRKTAEQVRQLDATKQATAMRSEQLKQQAATSDDKIQQALAALQKTFNEAKPQEREVNLQRLATHQKQIGEAWREIANQRRNDALELGTQRFGQANPQQTQKWLQDMKKGDTAEIRSEMAAISSELEKLSQMPSGSQKSERREQLAQRMNQLDQSLRQAATSPSLQAALQRAMEQLDMAKMDQLSKEALQAAQESMSLSEQELEQLAQAMKDQQSLEEALKNLQMAKQLADQQKLDGSQCEGCKSMSDYEALYKRLTQSKAGSAGGMGPSGLAGAGGTAEENDEAETNFKTERSPTQLSAGKTLLQWKTQELGPAGSRPESYQEAVKQVKQGVSEAIAAEQVPPGYHPAIQKYFDALPER